MQLQLPHRTPILFARTIVSRDINKARVRVSFCEVPSLAMLVESAAQSSSGIDKNFSITGAYLVSMKNIKMLSRPRKKDFEIEVINEYNLNNMKLMNFKVFEDTKLISTGSFTLSLSENSF